MPRQDIEFKTTDGTILRGWFYPPTAHHSSGKSPVLVVSHGFSAVKEQGLDDYSESFQAGLPSLAVLVYDQRGLGTSDAGPNGYRCEINPYEQVADLQDAITYAQLREEVDPDKVAIWGSSYSGGHVIQVGALDRRVKAVISQVPHIDGLRLSRRLIRPDAGMQAAFQADRHARAQGKEPSFMAVTAEDPSAPAALPNKAAHEFFTVLDPSAPNSTWQNKVSMRSLELLGGYRPGLVIDAISPTPFFMVVAEEDDMLTPKDLSLEAYARAREPKELLILKGDHFDAYKGKNLEIMKKREIDFMRRTLFDEQ